MHLMLGNEIEKIVILLKYLAIGKGVGHWEG